MTIEALKYINDILSKVTNYEFGEWSQYPIPDIYFVGEYDEVGEPNEDGRMESTFILTGTGRTMLALEAAKTNIKRTIEANERAILPNGNGIALFYSNALNVPTDNVDFYRIQINIQIFEWRNS